MSFNKTILEGYIGADPVLSTTNTQQRAVCNLRLCTNEGWTDKASGQRMEKPVWHTIVCWDDLARRIVQWKRKGDQILVEGRLQYREYMGKATYQDGSPVMLADGTQLMVKKFASEIVAQNIQFLGKPKDASAYAQPAGTAPVVAAAGNPAVVQPAFTPAAPAAPAPAPAPTAQPAAAPATFAPVAHTTVDSPTGV